jgi:tRNA threonylcarbamoyladenosine biosynthesis protein TsaB
VLILGIDTATQQAGCAIGGYEGVLGSVQIAHGRRHAENLAPSVEFLCRQSGISLSEISVIAVDIGPGLFTGLRVGIASAKAFAQALNIPMIGEASLDLLAFEARHRGKLIVSAIDARRSEIYSARYRAVPGGLQRIGDYQLGSPEDLASELSATREEILLVGDGARRYSELFTDCAKVEIADAGWSYPSAAALVQLAHPKAVREEFVSPSEIQPMYLRKPDAEINWVTRDRV